MHMQEKKLQSRQWFKKGTQGPIKAKVIASCIKHMVLAFFYDKGKVYTNHVSRGVAVNTDYISALKKFLTAPHQKRLDLDLMFLWDKTLVHTAQKVQQFLAKKKQIHWLPLHCPYLAPADFFLFPLLKRELAGLTLSLDKFKIKWEGAIRTLPKMTLPGPSRGGYSAAKNAFTSAMVTLKKGGTYIFWYLLQFPFYLPIVLCP
jgi:hypothetical protein